eukprot:jgi/Tetstr1/460635/TSEL_005832.t1
MMAFLGNPDSAAPNAMMAHAGPSGIHASRSPIRRRLTPDLLAPTTDGPDFDDGIDVGRELCHVLAGIGSPHGFSGFTGSHPVCPVPRRDYFRRILRIAFAGVQPDDLLGEQRPWVRALASLHRSDHAPAGRLPVVLLRQFRHPVRHMHPFRIFAFFRGHIPSEAEALAGVDVLADCGDYSRGARRMSPAAATAAWTAARRRDSVLGNFFEQALLSLFYAPPSSIEPGYPSVLEMAPLSPCSASGGELNSLHMLTRGSHGSHLSPLECRVIAAVQSLCLMLYHTETMLGPDFRQTDYEGVLPEAAWPTIGACFRRAVDSDQFEFDLHAGVPFQPPTRPPVRTDRGAEPSWSDDSLGTPDDDSLPPPTWAFPAAACFLSVFCGKAAAPLPVATSVMFLVDGGANICTEPDVSRFRAYSPLTTPVPCSGLGVDILGFGSIDISVVYTDGGAKFLLGVIDHYSNYIWLAALSSKRDIITQLRLILLQIRTICSKAGQRRFAPSIKFDCDPNYLDTACPSMASSPSAANGAGGVPYCLLHGVPQVDLSDLRVFGCTAYLRLEDRFHLKLEPRALKCMLVGQCDDGPGYWLYNLQSGRVIRSVHVAFLEGIPAHAPPPSTPADVPPCAHLAGPSQDTARFASPFAAAAATATPVFSRPAKRPAPPASQASDWHELDASPVPPAIAPGQYPPASRIPVPDTIKQALAGKYHKEWRASIVSELRSLRARNTFAYARLPLGRHAIGNKWVFKIDIETAFLNASLKEEIYMRQPKGAEDGTDNVLRLLKSIYAKSAIGAEFNMTDFGEAAFVLGMDLTRCWASGTIRLSQEQYTLELLEKYGMQDCSPAKTPMGSGHYKDLASDCDADKAPLSREDHEMYRAILGSVNFLTMCTRPDLAFAISVLSRFQSAPQKIHLMQLKRVLRYLKGTPGMGITYGATEPGGARLVVYSDSDWAADTSNRRSQSGDISMLNGGAYARALHPGYKNYSHI